jgi:DNA polymerase-3 subunit delta
MGVHLVTGSDAVLVGAKVSELVHSLVGQGDRTLMVDEFEPVPGEGQVGAVVDAAQTPPFLTDHRVVVARSLAALDEDELAPLVQYLGDPSPTTELVLVLGAGRATKGVKALTDAVKAAGGHVVAVGTPSGKQVSGWIDEQVAAAGLHLDHQATARIASWLGEEVNRLPGLLETLIGVYGEGARLRLDDVTPYLGDAGGVPPWDLTDAIDAGDTAKALAMLHRMMHGGERHGLQILATLSNHYTRMLKLDGTGISDPKAAADLLGLKGDYQARKVLAQLRAMGSGGLAKAIGFLSQADLDLKGQKDWDQELVMEVLVARLSRLTTRAAGRPVSSRR